MSRKSSESISIGVKAFQMMIFADLKDSVMLPMARNVSIPRARTPQKAALAPRIRTPRKILLKANSTSTIECPGHDIRHEYLLHGGYGYSVHGDTEVPQQMKNPEAQTAQTDEVFDVPPVDSQEKGVNSEEDQKEGEKGEQIPPEEKRLHVTVT
jgi:hypothetical protein